MIAAARLQLHSSQDLLNKHIYEKPVGPQTHNPDVTKEFNDLILQMLAKKRQDRPKDFHDVLIRMRGLRIFKNPPPSGVVPSCQEAGVLGALAGVIGTIQATEAVKLILGVGNPLTDRLLTYNALTTRFREVKLRRNPGCPVCSDHPQITELVDYEQEACAL